MSITTFRRKRATSNYPRVAVVGCGHWGRHLVRNFHSLGHLAMVCDRHRAALDRLAEQFPGILLTPDLDDVVNNDLVEAVVIATPSHTHYAIAAAALAGGKHVYVEKPMATRLDDAQALLDMAEQRNRLLMVGHLLMYHPAVSRLRQLIAEGCLGDVLYIQSDRLNFNPHRQDKNVLWDLAPHDVSMMAYLLGAEPQAIASASGHCTSPDGLVDIVHLDLLFSGRSGLALSTQMGKELDAASQLLPVSRATALGIPWDAASTDAPLVKGHIHISWVHPMKQVRLVVRGSQQTAVLDDTLPQGKLQLFPRDPFAVPEAQRAPVFPEYLHLEPLRLECQHFIHCVKNGKIPKTDARNGLSVIRVLSEAQQLLEAPLRVASPAV